MRSTAVRLTAFLLAITSPLLLGSCSDDRPTGLVLSGEPQRIQDLRAEALGTTIKLSGTMPLFDDKAGESGILEIRLVPSDRGSPSSSVLWEEWEAGIRVMLLRLRWGQPWSLEFTDEPPNTTRWYAVVASDSLGRRSPRPVGASSLTGPELVGRWYADTGPPFFEKYGWMARRNDNELYYLAERSIDVFSTSGMRLDSWYLPSELHRSKYMAAAGIDTVYIIDHANRIHSYSPSYSPSAGIIATWGGEIEDEGLFDDLQCAATSGSGEIFALDEGHIRVFDVLGTLVGKRAVQSGYRDPHTRRDRIAVGQDYVLISVNGDGVVPCQVFTRNLNGPVNLWDFEPPRGGDALLVEEGLGLFTCGRMEWHYNAVGILLQERGGEIITQWSTGGVVSAAVVEEDRVVIFQRATPYNTSVYDFGQN